MFYPLKDSHIHGKLTSKIKLINNRSVKPFAEFSINTINFKYKFLKCFISNKNLAKEAYKYINSNDQIYLEGILNGCLVCNNQDKYSRYIILDVYKIFMPRISKTIEAKNEGDPNA